MPLYRSRLTVFKEIAFGHLREDYVEHIHTTGEIIVPKTRAQIVELTAQKFVGTVDLQPQIECIHTFGQDQPIGEHFVDANVLQKLRFDYVHATVDGVLRWHC